MSVYIEENGGDQSKVCHRVCRDQQIWNTPAPSHPPTSYVESNTLDQLTLYPYPKATYQPELSTDMLESTKPERENSMNNNIFLQIKKSFHSTLLYFEDFTTNIP